MFLKTLFTITICLHLSFPYNVKAMTMDEDQFNHVRGVISDFVKCNEEYQHETPGVSHPTPRATVVLCSDSRCQSTQFDKTPENDDFFIRNIGNQLETSQGSVECGVAIANTPLLLFVGHSSCLAIREALYRQDVPHTFQSSIQRYTSFEIFFLYRTQAFQ